MARAIDDLARPLASAFRLGRTEGCCAIGFSSVPPVGSPVEAFLVSTAVVAVAEIGDKTQLLALVLACRFQRPLPIAFGMLAATLANHAAAAFAGTWITSMVDPAVLRWLLGLSFLAVAVWALIPDKLDHEPKLAKRFGPFLTTLIAFFLVEIGDKTQIATVGLAIRFESLLSVVIGTTVGMMIANLPVIVFGDALARRLPLRVVRLCAAAAFAVLGASVLVGWP
jgi:putative Ca2+/H+ antiporter (TMEM165/GDT1 family)